MKLVALTRTRHVFGIEFTHRTKRHTRWLHLSWWYKGRSAHGEYIKTLCVLFGGHLHITYGCKKRPYDDREKRSWSSRKWAIDRDGDWYLVECPQCHHQDVSWFKERHAFRCSRCEVYFEVYTEDGIRQLNDHRRGDISFPAVFTTDDQRVAHLGIAADAPWWWNRRDLYRDLRDGWDGHHHKRYEVLPNEPRNQCEVTCDQEQGAKS